MSGGERLPYLVAKLKAPRIGERLAATAERARAEGWAYEAFLEALLEPRCSPATPREPASASGRRAFPR